MSASTGKLNQTVKQEQWHVELPEQVIFSTVILSVVTHTIASLVYLVTGQLTKSSPQHVVSVCGETSQPPSVLSQVLSITLG